MNFLVSLVVIIITVYSLEASDIKDLKHNESNNSQIAFSQTLNMVNVPKINISGNEKDIEFSEFVIDLKQTLTKTISSKLVELFKKELKVFSDKYLPTDDFENEQVNTQNTEQRKSLSNSETFDRTSKDGFSNSPNPSEIGTSKKMVQSRHFVFHPYLSHGKETQPDEKISFHDILPVKMVKFVKSMVEDAPWEAMFMKMVRMVVDQFVDKIIEQMFAHKDELRSMDTSLWSPLRKALASVVRLRRSIAESKSRKEMEMDGSDFSQSNQLSKNEEPKSREASEDQSWLDSVLDYLFPEGEGEGIYAEEDDQLERRKREAGDTKSVIQNRMEDILHKFLTKYLDLSGGKRPPIGVPQTIRDSKQIPEDSDLERHRDYNHVPEAPELDNELVVTGVEDSKMSQTEANPRLPLPDRWHKLLHQRDMPAGSLEILRRTKRDVKEEKRLWQENQKSRASSLKMRDECSLRKACNAGRLLSRLPSVQDVTLQLKEYGNEPHWDALLWGMAKKRCSKIFCKRQRSPKGSKHPWRMDTEKKIFKKHPTYKRRTHKTFLKE